MPEHAQETWKPIPGYEDLYEVSNYGQVRSLPRRTLGKDGAVRPFPGKILKPRIQRSGHHKVVLYRGNGKSQARYVHQLVLEAFVGPRPQGMVTCHNDGIPDNNFVGNLRWDSQSSNTVDRVKHGRDPNLAKTHCPNGHLYDEENTAYGGHGERICKECIRKRAVASYHARAAEGGWEPRYGGTCKHGHEFTPENTYMAPSGYRECRTCRRDADRRSKERRAKLRK